MTLAWMGGTRTAGARCQECGMLHRAAGVSNNPLTCPRAATLVKALAAAARGLGGVKRRLDKDDLFFFRMEPCDMIACFACVTPDWEQNDVTTC